MADGGRSVRRICRQADTDSSGNGRSGAGRHGTDHAGWAGGYARIFYGDAVPVESFRGNPSELAVDDERGGSSGEILS